MSPRAGAWQARQDPKGIIELSQEDEVGRRECSQSFSSSGGTNGERLEHDSRQRQHGEFDHKPQSDGTTAPNVLVVTNKGCGASQALGGHAVVGRGGSESRKDAAVWGDGTSYSGGLRGTATYGDAIHGEAMSVGVEGVSSLSAGVSGEAQIYSGVHRISQAPYGTGGEPGQTRFGESSGVRGIGGNTGVEGFTGRGVGVWGGALSGVGVRGVSESDTAACSGRPTALRRGGAFRQPMVRRLRAVHEWHRPLTAGKGI